MDREITAATNPKMLEKRENALVLIVFEAEWATKVSFYYIQHVIVTSRP